MYLQVVNKTTADLLNAIELAIFALVVNSRDPVVAEILLNRARAASRSLRAGVVHGKAEAVAAHDGVHMAGDVAWVDDWVCALGNEWGDTWEAPEGVSSW